MASYRRGRRGTSRPERVSTGRPYRDTLARQIGNIFYRSRQEFNTRFSCQPIADPAIDALFFDFHNYLDHQGRKIVGHFDPNAYLRLSLSMDLHDLSRGHASMDSALQSVESEYLVIGVPQDPLIPIDEQLSFHRDLVRLGKKSTWVEFSSPYGHDAYIQHMLPTGNTPPQAMQ